MFLTQDINPSHKEDPLQNKPEKYPKQSLTREIAENDSRTAEIS